MVRRTMLGDYGIMGWGASPDDRRDILGRCRTDGRNTFRYKSDDTVYVVDGNATFRSFGSAVKGPDKSAEVIARVVIRAIVKSIEKKDPTQRSIASFFSAAPPPPPPKTAVVVLFDDAARMMPQRAVLHASRYSRPKPPEIVAASRAACAAADAAGLHDKQDFGLLFESATGKFKAYSFFARACEAALEQSDDVDAYAIGGPTGAVVEHAKREGVTFPPEWRDRTAPWGEADQKCFEASSAFASAGWKPIVVTIDTDMILQTIARFGDAPPARIALKAETLEGHDLASAFVVGSVEDSASLRLSAAALLAAAYGCDYCKPLSFAGFRKRSLASMTLRIQGKPATELPVACFSDVELTELATPVGTVETFAWTTPTTAVNVRTNNQFLTPHNAKPGRYVLVEADDKVLTRRVLPASTTVLRRRSGRRIFVVSPRALHRVLSGVHRTNRKLKSTGLPAGFPDIFSEFLNAAWSAVYFSGAGRTDVSAVKSYAGPPPIAIPSPTAQLFGRQHGACFSAYLEPLSLGLG
jgi:hypothetical protein